MEFRELNEMIEILGLAIAKQEDEEAFFRRSAKASTNDVAKNLFTEIADDFQSYRQNLEGRREKLYEALKDLKTVRDPVCSMKVDAKKTALTSKYMNKKYYFCSEDCKNAFDISPEKYVGH